MLFKQKYHLLYLAESYCLSQSLFTAEVVSIVDPFSLPCLCDLNSYNYVKFYMVIIWREFFPLKVKIISHRNQKCKTPVLGGDSCKWKFVYEINLIGGKNIVIVRIQTTWFSV